MSRYTRRATIVEAEPATADKRTFSAVLATSEVASDNHRLLLNGDCADTSYWAAMGWPILEAHDDQKPSVGKAQNVVERNGKLTGQITFARTSRGDEFAELYRSGMQAGVSISWVDVESRRSDRPPGALDFKRVKIIECSVVPLAADQYATVVRGLRSGSNELDRAATHLGVKLALKGVAPEAARFAIEHVARAAFEAGGAVYSRGDEPQFVGVAMHIYSKMCK